jgi:crotonobetainyl-CoA:carnitine CoA-transferase CaiB-like acyl-CoA transferase
MRVLDTYLSSLYELGAVLQSDEEEVEERFALVRKLKSLAKDPLAKKQYQKARKLHKTKLKKFQRDYTAKIQTAKSTKSLKKRKAKYAEIKAANRAREIRHLKKSQKELQKTGKLVKRRKRTMTATGLAGVGAAGFYASKRADEKGQSL